MGYLIFAKNVKRTPQTDVVISKLQPYFENSFCKAIITSVLRSPEEQLRIIEDYAKKFKLIPKVYKLNFDKKVIFEKEEVLEWQFVWSQLLNRGVIISPPVNAKVLMDYWQNGINKKGEILNPSPHLKGNCFDIGKAEGNCTMEDIYAVVKLAQHDNIGIRNVLLERVNNCVHCDV